MNKKFPYNTSDLKPSRRDFMRLGGASLAAAMMMRNGLPPFLAQGMGGIPAELHPGSPNNPRGWTTTLPPIPDGMPVESAGYNHRQPARSLGIRRWRRHREFALHPLERRGDRHQLEAGVHLDGQ